MGANRRVRLSSLALVLAAGCGQSTTGSSSPTRGLVYHVSILLHGSGGLFGSQSERGSEWLDPAGRRYRVTSVDQGQTTSVDHGHTSRHQVPVRTLDVGAPGVDESTTVFPGDLGGMSGAQTTLQYGSFGPAGPIAEPDYLGMAVLRAYVGYKVQGAPRFTVSHVGGRVRLTWRFPGFSAAVLKRLGAPSSVVKKFREAARQGRIVMTILGTTSRRQAQAKRLFAIDPARADQILRSLKPGVAPAAPSPSYWLGPVWDTECAQAAMSTIATHQPAGGDSYDVTYGRGPRASVGLGGGLNVSTESSPGGSGGLMRLLGHHGPFGTRGQRIHLEDGTPAYFYYQEFPPKADAMPSESGASSKAKMKLSATATITSSSWSMGGGGFAGTATSTQPTSEPPLIVVITRKAQIILSPGRDTTRGQAVRMAEALRPV